ncbi:MAG: hypothetical protein HC924_10020 [Synechococcaceae cyanobacterium SM2_3_2]|nr:hypothetical protein [Synechococcaceae cyanobacterium SM2_3_2]
MIQARQAQVRFKAIKTDIEVNQCWDPMHPAQDDKQDDDKQDDDKQDFDGYGFIQA